MNRIRIAISSLTFAVFLVFTSVNAEEPWIDSFSHNGKISWVDANTNGCYRIEWASSLSSTNWMRDWSNLSEIAATGGVIKVSVPMFYRVVHEPNITTNGLSETFEDYGDWSDHPQGSWIENADTGSWESDGMLFAHSSIIRAYSGSRYIGVGDNKSGYLYLPPIDNPTQLSFWVRGGVDGWNGRVYIEAFDGINWIELATQEVFDTKYVEATFPISFGVPNPNQELRLKLSANSGLAIYLDDIEIQVSP